MADSNTIAGAETGPERADAREQGQAVCHGEGAQWDDTPDAIADCKGERPPSEQRRASARTTTVREADHGATTGRSALKTKPERCLKARVPAALYEALLARAGAEGKHLGTHVREVLERDAQAITTGEALSHRSGDCRAPQVAAGTAAAGGSAADHELREVRLFVRELAMHANAQIAARVAAQLAAQPAAQPSPSSK